MPGKLVGPGKPATQLDGIWLSCVPWTPWVPSWAQAPSAPTFSYHPFSSCPSSPRCLSLPCFCHTLTWMNHPEDQTRVEIPLGPVVPQSKPQFTDLETRLIIELP